MNPTYTPPSSAIEARASIAEIAELMVGRESSVEELARRRGFHVAVDWAGRPSLSLADATTLMDEHRRDLVEMETQRRARLKLTNDVFLASTQFDHAAGEAMWRMRQRNEIAPDWKGTHEAWAKAKREAWEIVQSRWPEEVIALMTVTALPHFREPDPIRN